MKVKEAVNGPFKKQFNCVFLIVSLVLKNQTVCKECSGFEPSTAGKATLLWLRLLPSRQSHIKFH